MALTTRTRRRILMRRSSRASVISLLRPPPCCWLCVIRLHAFSIQSSTTPLATIVRSRMFQPRSSESVKYSQPRCLIRSMASMTKKASMNCSVHSKIGDWMSVSKPMTIALRTITMPTVDWKKGCSTQEKSAVNSTRHSRITRMNLASRARSRSGLKTRSIKSSFPESCFFLASGSKDSVNSRTPARTMMRSNQFQPASDGWEKNSTFQ
mmetsp:Transcript_80465/g.192970  ORF Transcript_80465/g.192970 Transcript_80465/m.192970 type:complete len:209 (+) Transcript_80465:1417-2043(+)